MTPITLSDKIDLALLGCGIVLENDDDDDKGEDGKDSTRFINSNQVDRNAMLQAMTATGHTVSSLADATGVEPSMISRLLRQPQSGDPDESARNPSMGLAARVSSELSISPEALFPDIFDSARGGARKNKNRDRKSKKHVQNRSAAKYQDGT